VERSDVSGGVLVEHREVGDLYRLLRAAVPLAMGIMCGGKSVLFN